MSKSVYEITAILKGAKFVTNNASIIDLLKKNNIDLEGQHGETALHWAAYYGNTALLNELIALGVNIDKQDKEKERTPIMWAMLRILRDPPKYIEIIRLLIQFKADVSLRDFKKQNIFDIVKFLRQPNENLSFLNDFKISDDSSFFNKEQKDRNLKGSINNFETNGDDSSDEEDTNAEKYNIKDHWAKFLINPFYDYLIKLGYEQWQIQLLFVLHVNGIMLLYSPSVNAVYYKETQGKKILGNNATENDLKTLKDWIKEALFNTIHIVIYFGRLLTEDEKSDILKKYCDTKADTFTQHLHSLLKKADLANAEAKLAKYNSNNDQAQNIAKSLRQSNPDLKGIHKNTVIINSPEKVSPAIARSITQSNDNLHYLNQCIVSLTKNIIPLAAQKAEDLKSISNSESSQHQNITPQAINKIIEYFNLYFFKELAILRRKYQILFNRGQNECVIYDFSQTLNNSNFWFNGVRKNNRFQKRRNHHFEERHYLVQDRSKKATQADDLKVSYGHYIHTYSIWKLPSKTQVLYKEMITTNQVRTSLVEFRTAQSTTYPALFSFIHEKSVQFATYNTNLAISYGQITELNKIEYYCQCYNAYTLRVANSIKSLLRGINPFSEQDSDADFISELTYLLFFCETSRNPASFIIHQMMLDLIIHDPNNKNWYWAFVKSDYAPDGGAMPMSIGNAVKFSGHINLSLAPFMPFPYIYGGEYEQNDVGIKSLINRTLNIAIQWFNTFQSQWNVSSIDITNLSKIINDTSWYVLPKSEQQLSELTVTLQSLSVKDNRSNVPLINSDTLIETLSDGNCAFNALALGICELIENKMLHENSIFDSELAAILGLMNKSRASIVEWLKNNTSHALRQQKIQSFLRKLAIDFIEKEYRSTYGQLYEYRLLAAFINYQLYKIEDDTFCVHKNILDYFKKLFPITELCKWWDNEAKNQYFSELRSTARYSLDKARWGCEVEIDAIATLLKINIYWKKQPSESGQRLGIGGGLIDGLSEIQSKMLTNLGIGNPSKGKFEMNCFKNKGELEKRLNPLTDKDRIFEIIKSLLSQKNNYFPDNIPNVNDILDIRDKLIERNIIDRDKENNNNYRFILKNDIIDIEEIEKRLNGIVDIDLKTKILCSVQYNVPEFGVIHTGNHWTYQRISSLEINNIKSTVITEILNNNASPITSNNALTNTPKLM